MAGLWPRISGYVILRVKGKRLETFLNLANREGIVLWNVSRPLPDRLYCSVSLDGFQRLRPIIKALHLSVSVRRRKGVPFLLQKVIDRKTLLIGIIIFGLLFYFASGFIWFINLSEVPENLREEVRTELRQAGLTPGVPRAEVNPREVERQVITSLENLSWVAVRLQGTAAFVEVVERTVYEDKRDQPSNLIASKSGVIQSIIAFDGIPLVSKGDTVQKGDPLISGVVPLEWYYSENELEVDEEEPNPLLGQSGAWGYLYADGLVEATVWYEGEAEVAYATTELRRSGKRSTRFKLVGPGFVYTLGRKAPSFVEFETETEEWEWEVPGTSWQLNLEKTTYYQLVEVEVSKDIAMAKAVALETARARVRPKIPPQAQILNEEVTVSAENGKVRVHILVSTLENIGVNNKIEVGDAPPVSEGLIQP